MDPLTCADDFSDGFVYDANLVVLWAPAVTGVSGVSGVPFVAYALDTFAPSITVIGAAVEISPANFCLTEILVGAVDRKRGGWGQSVAVLVYLVGRCILNK